MSELTDQIAQEWEENFEPACSWRKPWPEAPGCGHMHCEFAHDLRVRAARIEDMQRRMYVAKCQVCNGCGIYQQNGEDCRSCEGQGRVMQATRPLRPGDQQYSAPLAHGYNQRRSDG